MTPEYLNQVFSFLYEGRLGRAAWWLQLLAGIFSSAFFAAIIVITLKLREFYGPPPALPEPAKLPVTPTPWQEVRKKIESPNPSDWTLAVIQADAILEGILRETGLPGETLGERLKRLDPSKLASLNDLWEAHKIRNRIAHEPGRTLAHHEALTALHGYERALRELGYIE